MPASPEAWRCFVAVPVPPALRAAVESTLSGWRAQPGAPDLRWSDPDAWHVTLAFLGSTDPASVPGIASALETAVRDRDPFVVRAGGIGAFPRAAAAQTIWLGVEDPRGRLDDLADAVQKAVLPAEAWRRLRPHLTVARSRVRGGERLDQWLADRAVPHAEMTVRDVVLYRSHLGSGPARYEEVARLPLGGAGSDRG
jgi:2'-5' RNA ligase